MKKTTALWTLSLLVSLACSATASAHAHRINPSAALTTVNRTEAPPQAATGQWKSRDEYDAYDAMTKATDPDKKLALAEAFLTKFPSSDFKAGAYFTEMQVYYSQGKSDKAVEMAKKILEVDPNNLEALAFLSYVFTFAFKATDSDATAELSRADSDAHHGLDVLQKIQKPSGMSDEQFKALVNPKRALFNGAIGFVALQRKDFANSVTALKAAVADNATDVYDFYRLGLAYLYSTPPDYDNAIWYMARAVSLAKAAKNPAGDDIGKFLTRAYVNYHGNDTGLTDIEAQAAGSPNPPDGFKVAKAEAPKPTGNNNVDAFNTLTWPLKLGGPKAQQQWDGVKGQTMALGGTVMSWEKEADSNVYLLHIAVLDATKSAGGYDIELKDSSQPNVKNLQKDDLVQYKGTLDSYVATPNLILTLVGEVTSDLPDKPPVKEKPKPKPVAKPKPKPTTATTPPGN
jgi:tetratricopeptide (TPR) repeat protein